METLKHFSLLEEFDTSYKLINLGFGELQNLNTSNNFYFLPFQLLSQGFERLMKGYICISYYEINKKLPDFKYLKGLGHDLTLLLDEILKKHFFEFERNQYFLDYKFLNNDKEFRELLYIISEFGKHARYYNFDIITDSSKPSINTIELWKDFENNLMKRLEIPIEKLFSYDTHLNNEVHYEISRYIIIKFEKLVSAIARQIIFNKTGNLGKQLTINNIFDFGMLYENEFGNKDYRKITTKYREKSRKAHKRTIIDFFNRKFNSNYKHIKIKKKNFDGEWPFLEKEIIVESRFKLWYIVTINNKDYSLNGLAKSRYKLESPHESGMAVIGKSLGDFVKIAQKL